MADRLFPLLASAADSFPWILAAFVEDGDLASNIFDVTVGAVETGPFTKVLTDVPSNKNRPLTPQQFRIIELARYIRIEPSALGSGSLDITEVSHRALVARYSGVNHGELPGRTAPANEFRETFENFPY